MYNSAVRHTDFLVLLVGSCVLVMVTQCLIPEQSGAGALELNTGIDMTNDWPTLSPRDGVAMWGKAELPPSVVKLRTTTVRFRQEVSTNQPSGRASAKQVGTIMAILAVFQDADVLPPESSPDANRLIKALIQFQSAFMKSPDPAVGRLLEDALEEELGEQAPAAVEAFRVDGWTSQSLEALVNYTDSRPNWAQPDLIRGFRAYNIGPEDFELLARVFNRARTQLAAQGKNFHSEYAARRLQMPGAGK
ncbi:MAG: hypothetical protein ACE5NA_01470 [Nitrospiraceae bacterium]